MIFVLQVSVEGSQKRGEMQLPFKKVKTDPNVKLWQEVMATPQRMRERQRMVTILEVRRL